MRFRFQEAQFLKSLVELLKRLLLHKEQVALMRLINARMALLLPWVAGQKADSRASALARKCSDLFLAGARGEGEVAVARLFESLLAVYELERLHAEDGAASRAVEP